MSELEVKGVEVRMNNDVIFKPEQLVEVKAQITDGHWRGFYFRDHGRMAQTILKLDNDPRIQAVYFTAALDPRTIEMRAVCPCNKCKGNGGLMVCDPTDSQIEQIIVGPHQHLAMDILEQPIPKEQYITMRDMNK